MVTLVYSAGNDSDEERLLNAAGHIPLEVCRSVQQLVYFLNIPSRTRKIVILIIRNQDEMAKVSTAIELFFDLLLIIILDREYFETANDAHKLRPRFLTYKDGDFQDVRTVLSRMIHQV